MAEVVCNPQKKLGFIQANPLLEVEETTKDVDLTPSKKAMAIFSVAIQVSSGDRPPDPHGSSLHVLWLSHTNVFGNPKVFAVFEFEIPDHPTVFASNPKVFPENPIC